jgi:hypothetical protein
VQLASAELGLLDEAVFGVRVDTIKWPQIVSSNWREPCNRMDARIPGWTLVNNIQLLRTAGAVDCGGPSVAEQGRGP